MKFRLGKIKIQKVTTRRRPKEVVYEDDKRFIIYVVTNYNLFEAVTRFKYSIMCWSIIDQRYVSNTYTNEPDRALVAALKKFKMKHSKIMDIRTKSKQEIQEIYRIRVYG